MIAQLEYKVSGTYEIEIRNNGKLRKRLGPFDNLITDFGMNRLFNGGSAPFNEGCSVGNGITPPAFTDTALANQVLTTTSGPTRTFNSNLVGTNRWLLCKHTWQFAVDAYIGTITEVGVRTYSATQLISRSLLPVPVDLISGDQLTVVWNQYIGIPDDDIVSTVTDGANSYTVTMRTQALVASQVGGTIGGSYSVPFYTWFGYSPNARTMMPFESDVLLASSAALSSTNTNESSAPVYTTYVNGTFERSFTVQFSVTQGNFATGIGRLELRSAYSSGAYQFKFAPKLPKTSTNRLIVTIRTKLTRGTPP